MARKKRKPSSLTKLTGAVAARKKKKKKRSSAPRKNAALIANPPFWQDAYEDIVPGMLAYTGTRLAGRIGYRMARKKSVGLAKHVGPWTSVAIAALGWWAVHKIDWAKKYHTPVVVGAAVAALQGLVQTYLPQYGWILNDYHMDDALPATANGASNQLSPPPGQPPAQVPQGTADDMALEGILNEGEGVDDLYTGSFSGGWKN